MTARNEKCFLSKFGYNRPNNLLSQMKSSYVGTCYRGMSQQTDKSKTKVLSYKDGNYIQVRKFLEWLFRETDDVAYKFNEANIYVK